METSRSLQDMKLSCALLFALLGITCAYRTFDGYQVLRTVPLREEVLPQIAKLRNDPRFDFWSTPHVGQAMDVMTSPEHVAELRSTFEKLGLHPTVHIHDVGIVVAKERAEIETIKRSEKRSPREVTFDRFMELDEIMTYIQEVADANPDVASIVDIATSSEGRPVRSLKISTGAGKKAIWMDCAIHSREWAAPPICLKTIQEVIASPELQDLVDWYITPVANPDGYLYTWTDDRFWRKTRRPNPGSICVGTDPNRNFDWLWNEDSNSNPCSETYPGPNMYSEPECAGIASMVKSMGQSGDLILYLTIHSYGTLFYFPYGTQSEPAPTDAELQTAGDISAAAIEAVHGTRYDIFSESSPFNFIYGAMDDHAYGTAGVPYSYTVELPGGGTGFDPPPSYIRPVVEEMWAGVEAMVRHIHSLEA